jgi:hypothetical protein
MSRARFPFRKLVASLDEMRDGDASVRTRRNIYEGEVADLTLSDIKAGAPAQLP